MSGALANFIRQRLAELDAQEAEARRGLAVIEDERLSLKRAAEAASIPLVDVAATVAAVLQGANELMQATVRRRSERSMKDGVIETLRGYGRPMTAMEILPQVNQRLGTDYERTSLSPQLSRLKAEGKIVKLGSSRWGLPKWELKTNEADDVTTEVTSPAPISQQVSPPQTDFHQAGPAGPGGEGGT